MKTNNHSKIIFHKIILHVGLPKVNLIIYNLFDILICVVTYGFDNVLYIKKIKFSIFNYVFV